MVANRAKFNNHFDTLLLSIPVKEFLESVNSMKL